jgi:multiple sugar transport system ATP-binding protein
MIEIDQVSKRYGDVVILDALSLRIEAGELVVLVGPSGCGKSTLLRIIAGLLEPSSGTVKIGGRDVTRAAPGERDIAMVFQSYALYPHMTVFENIAFPLRVRRVTDAEVKARVSQVAVTLGLGDLLERKPKELSGGQRQRVAMGRAIVRDPKAFLFDEPLSNLDAALRGRMRAEIAALHRRLGATMIYVTHDQHEAMTLADRLVLLNKGRIEQAGPPLDVYRRPATRFAGEFLGSPPMSFLPAERRDDRVLCHGWTAPIPVKADAPERLWIGVRPEEVRIVGNGGVPAVVEWVERTGSEGFLYARVGDAQVVARLPASEAAREPGAQIGLELGAALLFDRASGKSVAG